MSVTYKSNTAEVKLSIERKASTFLRLMADEVDKEARKITPYSGGIKSQGGKSLTGGGHLRDSLQKQILGLKGKLVWNKVYAAPQEVGHAGGRVFKNYTTPCTGKDYAKKAVKTAVGRTGSILSKVGLR